MEPKPNEKTDPIAEEVNRVFGSDTQPQPAQPECIGFFGLDGGDRLDEDGNFHSRDERKG